MSGRRNYRNKRKPVRGGGHRFTPALRRSTAKRGEDEGMWDVSFSSHIFKRIIHESPNVEICL